MFLYGRAKKGKTLFACKSPDPLVLDLDHGISSVLSHGLNPAAFQPNSYSDMVEFLQKLEQHDEFGVLYEGERFLTLIVDSTTTAYTLIMHQVLTLPGTRQTDRFMAASGQAGQPREWPAIQDYGLTGNRLIMYLQALRKFRVHQVVISHEKDYQTGLLKELRTGPNLTESLIGAIPSRYDLYVRMRAEKDNHGMRYYVQTKDDGFAEAGERFDVLDPEETPDFTSIIRKCGGWLPDHLR
jgi:hypothetical protein